MVTHVGHQNRDNGSTVSTYILTIIRAFVYFSFGVGLLFGIFQSIKTNSFNGFSDGVMVGIVGALITIPIITVLDILEKVKCYLKYGIVSFTVHQKRTFQLEDNYMSVFGKLCNILSEHEAIEIYRRDRRKGTIEADAKRSWRSFGEKIKIELSELPNSRLEVTISSKPKISFTMFDYCKNLENVEMLVKEMNSSSGI